MPLISHLPQLWQQWLLGHQCQTLSIMSADAQLFPTSSLLYTKNRCQDFGNLLYTATQCVTIYETGYETWTSFFDVDSYLFWGGYAWNRESAPEQVYSVSKPCALTVISHVEFVPHDKESLMKHLWKCFTYNLTMTGLIPTNWAPFKSNFLPQQPHGEKSMHLGKMYFDWLCSYSIPLILKFLNILALLMQQMAGSLSFESWCMCFINLYREWISQG